MTLPRIQQLLIICAMGYVGFSVGYTHVSVCIARDAAFSWVRRCIPHTQHTQHTQRCRLTQFPTHKATFKFRVYLTPLFQHFPSLFKNFWIYCHISLSISTPFSPYSPSSSVSLAHSIHPISYHILSYKENNGQLEFCYSFLCISFIPEFFLNPFVIQLWKLSISID
jgi:hypothetical protein